MHGRDVFRGVILFQELLPCFRMGQIACAGEPHPMSGCALLAVIHGRIDAAVRCRADVVDAVLMSQQPGLGLRASATIYHNDFDAMGVNGPQRFNSCTQAVEVGFGRDDDCLLYTSPSPRDGLLSRMPSSA